MSANFDQLDDEMADPTKYTPGYSFSAYQASNPADPLPADEVDTEFANVKAASSQSVAAIKDIRRSDGKLRNGIVTSDSLSQGVRDQIDAALIGNNISFYNTYALASAALSGLPDGQIVEVLVDETRADRTTRYKKTGGVLVYMLTVPATTDDIEALPTLDERAAYSVSIDESGRSRRRRETVICLNDLGAVNDCTGQGIGTDLTPALLEAAALVSNGDRIYLKPGRYRMATSTTLDFGGKKGVKLDFSEADITTDAIADTMLTVENATKLTISANLLEGGIFNGWGATYPFGTDQFMTADDIGAAGGQCFLRVRGVMGYKPKLTAWAYAGRVGQSTPRSNGAHPQTQAGKWHVEAARNVGDTSKARVAQSLYCYGLPTAGIGNWGQCDRLTDDFGMYPPYWRDLNDIEIGSMDCAYATGGVVFEGCIETRIGYAYIGDIDGTPSGRHFTYKPSATRPCRKLTIEQAEFLNAGHGIYLESVDRAFVHLSYEGGGCKDLIEINNCVDVTISALGNGGERLAYIRGASTNRVKLILRNSAAAFTDNLVYIHSDVGGFIDLDTTLIGAASGKALVAIASTTAVVLINNNLLSSNTGSYLLDLPETNNVTLIGGMITGSATSFKNGYAPYQVLGLPQLASVVSNLTVRNGGNSAGNGGKLDFAIATNGFQADLPMAEIAGELVNRVTGEQQGDLGLWIRPNGVAGQSLVRALKLQGTTTDGETTAVLLVRDGGAYVAKKVLMAPDSGGYRVLRVAT